MDTSQGWYLYIEEEIIGPLTKKAIETLLLERRIDGLDFVTHPNVHDWVRLAEIKEFKAHIPTRPNIPTPFMRVGKTADKKHKTTSTAPKAAPTLELDDPHPLAWVKGDGDGVDRVTKITKDALWFRSDASIPCPRELKLTVVGLDDKNQIIIQGVLFEEGTKEYRFEFLRLTPAQTHFLDSLMTEKKDAA